MATLTPKYFSRFIEVIALFSHFLRKKARKTQQFKLFPDKKRNFCTNVILRYSEKIFPNSLTSRAIRAPITL